MKLATTFCLFLSLCSFGVCRHNTDHHVEEHKTGIPARISDANKQREILDREGKFVVEWETEADTATFTVTVETRGFVGFGLSPAGGMHEADIVIGGIDPNGNSYFAVIKRSLLSYVSMPGLSHEIFNLRSKVQLDKNLGD